MNFALLFIGKYLTLATYHILIFLGRKHDPGHFSFALFCLIYSIILFWHSIFLAVSIFQPLADKKSIHISKELVNSPIYIRIDPFAIDRILNNLIENAVRPFALGRKNWLFSGNPRGAKASAALYSLIETAKINGLEPYWYLRFLFEKLPLVKTQEDYKALLPYYIDKEELKSFKQSSDLSSAIASDSKAKIFA